MTAIGSLRVELELADGSFTTRVIRAGTSLEQLQNTVRKSIVSIRSLDDSHRDLSSTMREFVVTVGLARAALENLYSVFGKWLTSIVRINAEAERTTTLLKNMSTAATEASRVEEATRQYQELLRLTAQTPFKMETLINSFVKFRAAGIEPAQRQLTSLVEAVAAMGGTDEQLSRAATAIQQMVGKGVVSMEELRQQLGEAVPRAMELMARSMGMSVSQLVQKIGRGQVEARSALALLSAEFERTFGGSAAAQMETFNGRIAQLRNAWVNFSLEVGGKSGSGGFFDTLKDTIARITEALSSNEAVSFARQLNVVLTDLTKTIVDIAQWVYRWSDAILVAGKALATWFVITRVYALVSGLAVALNKLVLTFLNLPAALAGATAAMNTFGTAAGAAAGVNLAQKFQNSAAAILELGASAFRAFGAMSAFGKLLTGFTAVGAALVAFELISSAFMFIFGNAKKATEAVNDFKRGMNDDRTLEGVKKRITELPGEIAAAKAELEAVKARQRRELSLSPTSEFSQATRALAQTPQNSPYRARAEERVRRAEAVREAELAAHVARIAELEREKANLPVQLEGVIQENLQRQADRFAENRKNALLAQGRAASQAYDVTLRELSDKLAKIQNPEAPSNKDAVDAINRDRLTAIDLYYSNRLAATEEFIKEDEAKQKAALLRNDLIAAEQYGLAIKRLREYYEQLKKSRDEAAADPKAALLSADAANKQQQALDAIARTKARVAELRAEIAGSNPELAKFDALVGELSRLEGVDPKIIEQLREWKRNLGEAEAAVKSLRKANTSADFIERGLEKANTDLQLYKDKLADLNIPEKERTFRQFERAMLAAFEVFEKSAIAAGKTADEIVRIRNAMLEAVDAARDAADLADVTDYLAGAAERKAKLAGKGTADRLSQQLSILEKQYQRRRGALIRSLSGDDLARELMALQDAYDVDKALAGKRNADEGASLGRKAENQLARMRGRLAELREEIQGGGGEAAKFMATLGGRELTKTEQETLAVAKALDELKDKAEIAANAWSTLKSLVREGGQGMQELSLVLQERASGRNPLETDEKYAEALAKQQRALADLRRSGVKEESIAQQEAENVKALPGIAQGILAQYVGVWAKSNQSIRDSLATSNAERRQIALEGLDFEEKRVRNLIAKANMEPEARKKVEEDLAEYLSMSRKKIDRETEGSIAKMMRDWGNLSDNIENAFTSAFDGMADALAEFVMTGKLSFTSLANSLIRDLIRIGIKAAASGIFDLISPGGGAGGILKSIGGFIGSFFTGGSTAAGASSGLSAHTGAIVGKGGKAITISDGLLAGAHRYHKGSLRPDELPAILQKGEAVFTADQLAELGRLNRSYEFVEKSLGAINSALSAPVSAMPSMPAAPVSGAGGMAPPVTVNIINQSGQQLEASAGAPRMDIEGMIIDVVVSNIQRPGRMRDAVKGVV